MAANPIRKPTAPTLLLEEFGVVSLHDVAKVNYCVEICLCLKPSVAQLEGIVWAIFDWKAAYVRDQYVDIICQLVDADVAQHTCSYEKGCGVEATDGD